MAHLLIDGHLDIAMNALCYERDQTLGVAEIRCREEGLESKEQKIGGGGEPGIATQSLPELRAAGAAVVAVTLIARCKPEVKPHRQPKRDNIDYPTREMAEASAYAQWAYYQRLQKQNQIVMLCDRRSLREHVRRWQTADEIQRTSLSIGVILTMEGADPLVQPQDVHDWYERGLRALSLAHYGAGCYAFGTTQEDGQGLTELGRQLLREMAKLKMPLDLTHLCDASMAEAIDAYAGPIYASHSNSRAVANNRRQLTDGQARAIIDRQGIIGLPLHNHMIRWIDGQPPKREQVTLEHLADHVDHFCQLAGSTRFVALGSDMDGGFGVGRCPSDFDTARDLHRLRPILDRRGYLAEDIDGIFFGNWLAFWDRVLPAG